MNKFQKQLRDQSIINDAEKKIFKYLKDDNTLANMYRTMAEAQTILMRLTEMNRAQAVEGKWSVDTAEITNFFIDVSDVYKLIEPFAVVCGQLFGDFGEDD